MATGTSPTSVRTAPDPSSAADPHVPALDGIRGLAVLAVLAFHLGAPWAPGGFLGVSVFFTLSGFLITRLLLREAAVTGAIGLVAFWARRLRRLLPAALLTIALVLVLSAVAPTVAPDALRGDVLAALGYVANWRFLSSGQSYADLFQAPSPLLHFWSLAIEEQFYLLFPIVVWLVVRARPDGAGYTRRIRVVLVIGVAASVAVGVVAGRVGDADFVYYSLPTRAAELLAGALLATSVGSARLVGRRAPTWVTASGFAALAALVLLCVTTTRTSAWIADGGLPLFALVSVGLVLAALADGPFAAMLAGAARAGRGHDIGAPAAGQRTRAPPGGRDRVRGGPGPDLRSDPWRRTARRVLRRLHRTHDRAGYPAVGGPHRRAGRGGGRRVLRLRDPARGADTAR